MALRLVVAAVFLMLVATTAAPKNRRGSCYPRLFSFGDLLIDTGNFIHYSKAPGSVSRSPYVKRLGFPYWPAYLQAKSPATKDDFRYGANFAVASGTALNQLLFQKKHLDVSGITPYSLGIQIGWFKKVLSAIASTKEEQKEVMVKSLFLLGEIGANDYNHPFFQNKTLGWVKPLVPRVIRSIGLSIEVPTSSDGSKSKADEYKNHFL
ncbi:hypothetical protein ACQ4PT_020924 [Festuca glaucescens]